MVLPSIYKMLNTFPHGYVIGLLFALFVVTLASILNEYGARYQKIVIGFLSIKTILLVLLFLKIRAIRFWLFSLLYFYMFFLLF
jgi:hypothetical protein